MTNIFTKAILFFLLSFSVNGEEQKKILFLGDSLTAGFGVEQELAFPNLVLNKIDKKKLPYTVLNAGVSGNTSAGGLRRINWYFKTRVDIIIIALGANDGLRGLPVKSTEENLQKIIDAARLKNPKLKIILAGMKVPPNMGKKYSEGFTTIFPKLAKKNNCELIPFLLEKVAGLKDKNLADGIHPNPAGHRQIAENVMDILGPLIQIKK
jgi:acyl-CoA thioesterase I